MTFFWAISDFLSGKSKSMSVAEGMVQGPGDEALLQLAADPSHPGSGAALWMLLLLRLTSVATDERLELRNSKYRAPSRDLLSLLTQLRCYSDPDANNLGLWR